MIEFSGQLRLSGVFFVILNMKFFTRIICFVLMAQFYSVLSVHASHATKQHTSKSDNQTDYQFTQKTFLTGNESSTSGFNFRLSERTFRTVSPLNAALFLKIQQQIVHLKIAHSAKLFIRKLTTLCYNGYYIYSLRKILI